MVVKQTGEERARSACQGPLEKQDPGGSPGPAQEQRLECLPAVGASGGAGWKGVE